MREKIKEQKNLAARQVSRSHWRMLGLFLLGVLGAALSVLYLGTEPSTSLYVAVFASIGMWMLLEHTLLKQTARCPRCGREWAPFSDRIMKMKTCPRCGLLIGESPRGEAEELMHELLPFAKRMLKEYEELLPYGGRMSLDGEVSHVGASDGTERPSSLGLVEIMTKGFREEARRGVLKACVIICDVRIVPPRSTAESDAVQVCLDHVEGYSVEVFLPYRLSEGGELTFGEAFAREGAGEIFGAK